MKHKKIIFLLFLLGLLFMSWGVYEFRYGYSYRQDVAEKPWAYSQEAHAKLLVGQWQGNFIDPNGVAKNITLEVFLPTTEEERKKAAGKSVKHKRSVGALRKEKRHFDGLARVESVLGTEQYHFYGYVGEQDFHVFTLHFGHEDETKRLFPNFALNLGEKGHWQDDELSLELHFTYLSEKGSSFWDSENPKHQQISIVKFRRK